ncbi:MFS transporter [Dickeya dadantii]|uniref:MFS transporter n=1 Tax=Dickeya dadantii TaxID=204038 RepID=UPI001495EF66|nr:MFS transporter [Dickeya dadantii]NPE52178.1 MFS transporter [Dickeya dadantii]
MVYSIKDVNLIRLVSIPWGFLLLNGITFPFLIHKGLSVSEVFMIQSILAFSMVVAEVPSGLFTDRFGNKSALLLAGLFKGIGGMMAWALDGFFAMAITWIFIGLANSFYSGTNLSVIYRSSLNQERKTGIFSDIYQWGNCSFYLAIFLGAWISKYSIEIAALINGLVACTPVVIFSFISKDSRFEVVKKEVNKTSVLEKIKLSFSFSGNKGMVLSLFAFSAVFCVIFNQSSNLVQVFLLAKGFEAHQIGLAVGGLGLLGLFLTKLLSRKILALSVSQTVFLVIGLTLAALSLFMNGVVAVFIAGAILLELVKYLTEVYIVDAINRSYQGDMIASLNSLLSLVKRFAVMLFAPLIGVLLEKHGLDITLKSLTCFYLVISAMVVASIFFMSLKLKKHTSSENRLVRTAMKKSDVVEQIPEFGEYQQTLYASFDQHYKEGRDGWSGAEASRKTTLKLLGLLKRSSSVLDIGCGKGIESKVIAEQGHKVLGIDIIDSFEFPPDRTLDLNFRVGNFLGDSLVFEKYDAVLDNGCFHHQHPSLYITYLQKVYDCLNDDGFFAISIFATEDERQDKGEIYVHKDGRLGKEFSASEIMALFSQAGFTACYQERYIRDNIPLPNYLCVFQKNLAAEGRA